MTRKTGLLSNLLVVTVWKQALRFLLRNGGLKLEYSNESNILTGIETELEIEFKTTKEAEIVLKSIKPEINGSPSDRTSVSIRYS